MRIAILCDGHGVARWQRDAIDRIQDYHEIFLLVCPPPRPERRRMEHACYYALNLFSIRNRVTARVPFPTAETPVKDTYNFAPNYEGAWACLPEHVLAWLKDSRIDAILRFNLNLLRIPDNAPPILSYHHGDPRAFRGRPAGYYETEKGEAFVGQVVQILSNRLDAGAVLAFAESMVFPHSYRATIIEAFSLSPFLLEAALRKLSIKETLAFIPAGRNYKLPKNHHVLRFIVRMLWALLRRIAYGAFIEKRWKVSTLAVANESDPAQLIEYIDKHKADWLTPRPGGRHSFYADCFFSKAGLLVEGLNARSGKGEIVLINEKPRILAIKNGGHVSYPFVFEQDGKEYIIPETAKWAAPAAYIQTDGGLLKVFDLDFETPLRIIDPTLIHRGGSVYLFGNAVEEGVNVLHLWVAEALTARFRRHPSSPVCLGGRGARMAGPLLTIGGHLYRLGQDFRRGYGSGVVVFEVDRLDEREYAEHEVAESHFSGVSGPHTLSSDGPVWAFDWYDEVKSPLAGLRRMAARL